MGVVSNAAHVSAITRHSEEAQAVALGSADSPFIPRGHRIANVSHHRHAQLEVPVCR